MTERNDAPKLTDFKVHFGDATGNDSEPQPLRICVAAQWGARPDVSTRAAPAERVMAVNADNFDYVFERFGPAFAVELDDPVDPKTPRLEVFLRWSKLSSLRPNEIVETIPELSGLLEAHRVLERADARTPRGQLESDLERVLPRRHWVDALLALLDRPAAHGAAHSPAQAEAQRVAAEAMPRVRQGSSDRAPDSLGSLLDLVDVGAAEPSPAAEPVETSKATAASLVNRLAGITPAQSTPKGAGIEAARDWVRLAFARLLTDLLEHPEVLRLEGLWRGLRVLLQAGSRCKQLQLFVAWLDQGEEERLEEILAQDFDLLCLDREADGSARQLDLLERAATLGAEYQTATLVNASPALVGQEHFHELNAMQQKLLLADDVALRNLQLRAAKPVTRWLALVGNPLRIRAPHDMRSSRLKELKFEQAHTNGAYVLMPPTFGLTALVIRSLARDGHPFAFTGPDQGALSELEVHHFEQPDLAIATQDLVGTDAQDNAAEIGVALWAPIKNRAVAVLSSAPLLFRGEEAARGATPRARHLLSEALFLSRLTRVLRETKRRFQDLPDDAYERRMRSALGDLFPNAAPPGPTIDVRVAGATLKVTIDPRRYGTLSVGELSLETAR